MQNQFKLKWNGKWNSFENMRKENWECEKRGQNLKKIPVRKQPESRQNQLRTKHLQRIYSTVSCCFIL